MEGRRDRQGESWVCPMKKISTSLNSFLLLFPLVQIQTLSNNIHFLSNDPTTDANKANIQNLDFPLPWPKSKPAFYVTPSGSQETTNYSIQW